MEYNHSRELSEFQKSINVIKEFGFKPIAVSQMYFEDTFVFETDTEALLAFELLKEKLGEIVGWWYGKKRFLYEVEQYEMENETKVLIHYL